MELITLQIYDTAIAARIIKNRLESEDIRCYILDENIVTLDPLLNYAVGGIRLQVNKEDLERAKSILAEIDDTPLTDDQDEVIECPNCQSTQLYTDFKSIKDPKGFLAMIAAFI